jgi:hypothetical protein
MKRIIRRMSSVTIQEVYNKLLFIEEHMVTKEELEPFIDTIEILSNHETMQALAKSDDDIKKGNGKSIAGIDDLLAELDTE